jgi:hypothetical protein
MTAGATKPPVKSAEIDTTANKQRRAARAKNKPFNPPNDAPNF